MIVFITGTNTDIGKSLVSSWLCLHTKYDYFKPIQTGSIESMDSMLVKQWSGANIHPEAYVFKQPLSPHLAASAENAEIDITKIKLPKTNNLIVEGAGGLLVPINDKYYIIDLIRHLNIPVILVATSTLGTINHTLLSLEALRARNIKILGVIISGEYNQKNKESIQDYGNVEVLAELPFIKNINYEALKNIPLDKRLKNIFGVENESNKT